MPRIIPTAIAGLGALFIYTSPAEAQRHNGAQRNERTERSRSNGGSSERKNAPKVAPTRTQPNRKDGTTVRPGRTQRNDNKSTRPGRNDGQKPSTTRPGNNYRPGNGNNNRPGNSGNQQKPPQTNRPGNNGNRPGNGNQQKPPQHNRPAPGSNRPTPGNNRPIPGYNRPPHYRPNRPIVMAPPVRPYRPPMRPFRRPVRPAVWRPWTGPSLGNILGIAFGTALTMSLDYLYNNNYSVDGYNEDVVYLRNVNQMNYIWPDATLYYGPSGLIGSQFSYSTAVRDMSRYNSLYMNLVGRYGQPVSYTNNGGIMEATWFGAPSGYITLQFGAMNPGSGTRFYTTLQLGN